MGKSRSLLGRHLDRALTERVDQIFVGENLTETILHAHLLIERALTNLIADKLAQPNVLLEGQWSFYQKCSLYIGLYDPEGACVRRLRGFNRLRNVIAHVLEEDIDAAVAKYLVIEKERPDDRDIVPPDALSHVRGMAGMILMCDLRAVTGFSREPIDWDSKRPLSEIFGEAFDRLDGGDAEGEDSN